MLSGDFVLIVLVDIFSHDDYYRISRCILSSSDIRRIFREDGITSKTRSSRRCLLRKVFGVQRKIP